MKTYLLTTIVPKKLFGLLPSMDRVDLAKQCCNLTNVAVEVHTINAINVTKVNSPTLEHSKIT